MCLFNLNHRLRSHIFTECSGDIKMADCAAYRAHILPRAVASDENEYYVQE